jgi:hypothetical protein
MTFVKAVYEFMAPAFAAARQSEFGIAFMFYNLSCYRRLRTDPSHRYKWTHPKVASFDFAEIGAPV